MDETRPGPHITTRKIPPRRLIDNPVADSHRASLRTDVAAMRRQYEPEDGWFHVKHRLGTILTVPTDGKARVMGLSDRAGQIGSHVRTMAIDSIDMAP